MLGTITAAINTLRGPRTNSTLDFPHGWSDSKRAPAVKVIFIPRLSGLFCAYEPLPDPEARSHQLRHVAQ